MQRWSLLILLLSIPGVAGQALDLQLPDDVEFQRMSLLTGAVELHGATVQDPVLVEPASMRFGAGILTVCPVTGGGTIRSVLANLTQDCVDGDSYAEATLHFGKRSQFLLLGDHPLLELPNASVWALARADPFAALGLFSGPHLGVENPGGLFRMAPLLPSTSVRVQAPDGPIYYNGTGYAFLHGADAADIDTQAVGAWIPGSVSITLAPGDIGLVRSLPDRYLLLDVQEALLGRDAREPRANLSALVQEFGRVADFINGAIYGHLNGTVDAQVLDGGDVVLYRVDGFNGTLAAGRMQGEADSRLLLRPQSVAIQGGDAHTPPWSWAIALWIVAAAVALVRRHPVAHAPAVGWVRGATVVVGAWLVDQWLLARAFGTSALEEAWRRSWDDAVALLAFQLVVLGLAWVLFLRPLDWIASKLVPQRWALVGALGSGLVWSLLLLLFPAAFFAAGYALARL